jgi:hypothetical protein
MDDHLGRHGRDGLGHRVGVKRVGHDRARSQSAQEVLLRRAPGHPGHLMAAGDKLRDERSTENTRGSSDKDLHNCSFCLIYL